MHSTSGPHYFGAHKVSSIDRWAIVNRWLTMVISWRAAAIPVRVRSNAGWLCVWKPIAR